MGNFFRIITTFLLSAVALSACEEDNVPDIDESGVEIEQILGGWRVMDTDTHVSVDVRYQAQVAFHNLRDKLDESFSSKASDGSLYFRKDKVFYLRKGFVRDSSSYYLDGNKYIIHYENPNVVGFYAPLMYVKMEGDNLVLYLRKSEIMDLLRDDGSLDGWVSTINSVVEDAQCEIYFSREYDELYDELEAMGPEE